MSKRLRTIVLIVAAALALGLVVLVFANREPIYQGEPLSYWVFEHPTLSPAERQERRMALSSIGKAAVPHLIRWLKERDSQGKLTLWRTFGNVPLLGESL